MTHQNHYKFHKLCHHKGTLLLALTAALCVSVAATNDANALYILTGVEDSAIVLDGSQEAPKLTSELISLSSGSKGYDVKLQEGQTVTVTCNGKVTTVTSKRESVASLLKRLDINPGPLDMVAVSLSGDKVSLSVGSDLTTYDYVTEPAPFQTIRRANPSMKKGEEKVVQQGVDGVRTSVYEVAWSNGEMISRQFVEELDSTAKDQIVEYGTYEFVPSTTKENIHSPIANVTTNPDGSGVLTLTTGEKLPFSGVRSMKATAYTAGHDGVGTRTATGTHVRRGTVAVDKRVIPLGTRMYVVTADGSYVYGLSVAEDTGYVGNNLDLYHDTYQQCINFGRRNVTVYILK